MSVPAPSARGTAPFGDYKTWYRVTGDLRSGRTPLVVVHGGPGSTHDYLLPMAGLAAASGHPVVHYDQLGNGGSTRLPHEGADFWTVDLFLAELDNLLAHLGIGDRYALYGHSWGGLLVSAHAARRPAGLTGVVIANSPASYPLWLREMKVLRDDLPPGVDATLRRHEEAGTTDTEEYFAAMRVFYDKHVCRADPWPREFYASFVEISQDPTVYHAMNGPTEFHVIGTLKDWGVEDLLPSITCPVLVVAGAYDEATRPTWQPFLDLIPQATSVVFPNSSHTPHLEEPDVFTAVLSAWVRRLG